MCDVCGMQYVGQTNNIRSRMNGHKPDYRRFLNGDFSKLDTSSLYLHLMMLKFSCSNYLKLNILKTFVKKKLVLTPKIIIGYGNWKLRLRNGLSDFDTFYFDSKIHHPGLGHRE